MWTPKGKRPIVLTSGSHQKTCVFGALCIDGQQFFRQYSTFNQDTFLQYLKELQRKFKKLILFLDKQPNTIVLVRSKNIWKKVKVSLELNIYPKDHRGSVLLKNAGGKEKNELLVSRYYSKFRNLKKTIAEYYRTKRFRLDITNYLLEV